MLAGGHGPCRPSGGAAGARAGGGLGQGQGHGAVPGRSQRSPRPRWRKMSLGPGCPGPGAPRSAGGQRARPCPRPGGELQLPSGPAARPLHGARQPAPGGAGPGAGRGPCRGRGARWGSGPWGSPRRFLPPPALRVGAARRGAAGRFPLCARAERAALPGARRSARERPPLGEPRSRARRAGGPLPATCLRPAPPAALRPAPRPCAAGAGVPTA